MVNPYILIKTVKILTYFVLARNQYACRKTLADSRPRIRGRFARNDEIDKNTTIQWSQIGAGEDEDEEDENWITMLDSIVAANFAQESQGSSSFGLFY